MGAWRDCFGKNGYHIPVLQNRFVQHVIAFIATFCLCFFVKGIKWWWSAWIAVWVQIEWAVKHGCAYDIGTTGTPDEKMLERYKSMVGYKLLCKIFNEDEKYGICFDFVLLAIRYTYPLIPICMFFNPCFLFLGVIISSLYLVYRHCSFLRKYRLLDVEIYVGLVVGFFISFL
jgi:hypothetical protein